MTDAGQVPRPFAPFARQRGQLFLWVPVMLACGIGAYFSLPGDPGRAGWSGLAVGLVLLGAVIWRTGARYVPLMALWLVLAGVALAGARTAALSAPVLGFRYYGPVEGRVVAIDRSASDKTRIVLDGVRMGDLRSDKTPPRVRVSLHGDQGFVALHPGRRVMMTAHLSPPGGPVEPGGFDFRRKAWFDRLGAVGYTRTPVLAADPDPPNGVWLFGLRMKLSKAVQAAMPGRPGAFAAAVTTGDRSGMDAETVAALRRSNLAHLLAISGLHMGLLTGFVFSAVRLGLSLVPAVGTRFDLKKIAALAGLMAGAVYLALSGGAVATERAFIMVAVIFAAVLLDLRAITLRAVALAALVVLIRRPEELLGPGFQMSFAATTALVAVFGVLRQWQGPRLPRPLRPIAAVVLSSAIAGLATAPISAIHFNVMSHYGLIANLLSVPLMGVIVMPCAVIAALLAPLGLEGVGFAIMEPAIRWILAVAARVSEAEGAVGQVAAPGPWVLPLVGLGGVTLVLWRGPGRIAGAGALLLAALLWAQAERPEILIAESGGLVGVMTQEGRVLNKSKGDGFVASIWLENDGDAADQRVAGARPGFEGPSEARRLRDPLRLVVIGGRDGAARARAACEDIDVVVTRVALPEDGAKPGPCLMLDSGRLRETGALAWRNGRWVSVAAQAGRFPWVPRAMQTATPLSGPP